MNSEDMEYSAIASTLQSMTVSGGGGGIKPFDKELSAMWPIMIVFTVLAGPGRVHFLTAAEVLKLLLLNAKQEVTVISG